MEKYEKNTSMYANAIALVDLMGTVSDSQSTSIKMCTVKAIEDDGKITVSDLGGDPTATTSHVLNQSIYNFKVNDEALVAYYGEGVGRTPYIIGKVSPIASDEKTFELKNQVANLIELSKIGTATKTSETIVTGGGTTYTPGAGIKFVGSAITNAYNQVTGTTDTSGTTWDTLTIGGVTHDLPAGGTSAGVSSLGGATGAIGVENGLYIGTDQWGKNPYLAINIYDGITLERGGGGVMVSLVPQVLGNGGLQFVESGDDTKAIGVHVDNNTIVIDTTWDYLKVAKVPNALTFGSTGVTYDGSSPIKITSSGGLSMTSVQGGVQLTSIDYTPCWGIMINANECISIRAGAGLGFSSASQDASLKVNVDDSTIKIGTVGTAQNVLYANHGQNGVLQTKLTEGTSINIDYGTTASPHDPIISVKYVQNGGITDGGTGLKVDTDVIQKIMYIEVLEESDV